MIKFLNAFTYMVGAIKKFFEYLKKEELKNAAQESLDSKDQRKLEGTIGSGSDTTNSYPGVYERPRQKKD